MLYLRWLGLAISLFLASALSGFIAMRYAIKGTTVLTPELIGKPIGEVSAVLTTQGLGIRIVGTKAQPGSQPGVVLSQEPIAGTPVKPNQMVRVVVSSGEKREVFPRVVGASLRIAQISLQRAGRSIGDVSWIHLDSEGAAEVLCQTPLPEEGPGTGILVHLLVNSGANEPGFVMPELVGRDVNEAIKLFESSRIRIETISYRTGVGVNLGQVVSQQPDRGYRLTRQTPVKIVVSR